MSKKGIFELTDKVNTKVRIIGVIIAFISISLSIAGNVLTVYKHINDKNSHFVGNEKRQVFDELATLRPIVEDAPEIVQHVKDKTVHMPLEKKIEMFYTRREANQLKDVIERLNKAVIRLNNKIDKLN